MKRIRFMLGVFMLSVFVLSGCSKKTATETSAPQTTTAEETTLEETTKKSESETETESEAETESTENLESDSVEDPKMDAKAGKAKEVAISLFEESLTLQAAGDTQVPGEACYRFLALSQGGDVLGGVAASKTKENFYIDLEGRNVTYYPVEWNSEDSLWQIPDEYMLGSSNLQPGPEGAVGPEQADAAGNWGPEEEPEDGSAEQEIMVPVNLIAGIYVFESDAKTIAINVSSYSDEAGDDKEVGYAEIQVIGKTGPVQGQVENSEGSVMLLDSNTFQIVDGSNVMYTLYVGEGSNTITTQVDGTNQIFTRMETFGN